MLFKIVRKELVKIVTKEEKEEWRRNKRPLTIGPTALPASAQSEFLSLVKIASDISLIKRLNSSLLVCGTGRISSRIGGHLNNFYFVCISSGQVEVFKLFCRYSTAHLFY